MEWVAEEKGRESIRELARTGGVEMGWRESSGVIYRPCFASMMSKEKIKEGEEGEWSNRGNKVELVRGEKKEVMLRSWVECGKMLTDSRFRDRNQRLQLSVCLQPELRNSEFWNSGVKYVTSPKSLCRIDYFTLQTTMFGSWKMKEE